MSYLTGLLGALAFFYAFYCGTMALWSYFEMADIVDRAVEDHARAGPVLVREAIVKGAATSGVPVAGDAVLVSESGERRGLRVQLRWSWPVIHYQGQDVLQIPLSLEREFERPPS
jgi:hypothetical protein